ncbi:MAG TPA: hypothetical protein VF979_10340 [Streptosporangiaceae bacterium]
MDLTAENLVAALAVTTGEQSEDIAEIVEIVRKTEPNFAATLFSAWQAEGIELSPALREEVDEITRKVEFYRSVAARLLAEVDSLTTIKGLEVGALYPPGLVRYQNDLDFITFREPDLWRAVGLLTDDGWTVDTATFSYLGGKLTTMVSVRKPFENPFRLAYGVELATYYTLGNQGGIPPIVKMPDRWLSPPVKNTIMLLHERYEQPFRARDVVDAALLHRSMSEPDRRALQDAVASLNLVLAYSELIKLVNAAGLGPLAPLPGGLLTTAKAAATRAARGSSFLAKPVTGTGRHLQRRLMMAKPSRAEGVIWNLVQRRLHPAAAVRAGLLGFGLPVTGQNPDETVAVLRERGEYGWVDTPAGRFLLTIGDYVSETAVEELSADLDSVDGGSGDGAGDLTE